MTTPSQSSPITQAAIEEAREEYTSRLGATGRTDELVVVAKGVTLKDLEEIPHEWLTGLSVLLHADGELYVYRLVLREQTDAAHEAALMISKYAKPRRAHGLRYARGSERDLDLFGRRLSDASLDKYEVCGVCSPLVVVEVIVGTPTCQDMMNAVSGYLYCTDTVERVVIFQVFPSSPTATEQWEVPALAVVFGFEDPTDRSSSARILEIKSFGNVGVKRAVVESLVSGLSFPEKEDGSSCVEPLDRERGLLLLEPGIAHKIHSETVISDLEDIRRQAHAAPLELRVPMAEPLDDLTFDLVSIFTAAMEGRVDDQLKMKHYEQRAGATDGRMAGVSSGPRAIRGEY